MEAEGGEKDDAAVSNGDFQDKEDQRYACKIQKAEFEGLHELDIITPLQNILHILRGKHKHPIQENEKYANGPVCLNSIGEMNDPVVKAVTDDKSQLLCKHIQDHKIPVFEPAVPITFIHD